MRQALIRMNLQLRRVVSEHYRDSRDEILRRCRRRARSPCSGSSPRREQQGRERHPRRASQRTTAPNTSLRRGRRWSSTMPIKQMRQSGSQLLRGAGPTSHHREPSPTSGRSRILAHRGDSGRRQGTEMPMPARAHRGITGADGSPRGRGGRWSRALGSFGMAPVLLRCGA